MIVVSVLFKHKPYRSHSDITLIKAALVNADLLAFFCMEFSVMQTTVEIRQKNGREFNEVHREILIEIWRFMRHYS
jgi:hypothetical protein